MYGTAENQIGVLGEMRNRSRTDADVEDTWIGEVMGCCRLWLLMKSSNNRLNGWRSENTSIHSLVTEEVGAEGGR